MVSELYILHSPELENEFLKSEILLNRIFYEDIPLNGRVVDTFDSLYKKQKSDERTPFIYYKGINYIYLKESHDLIMLLVTRKNIDAMLMVLFLHNFTSVLKHYLCVPKSNGGDKENNNETLPFDKDIIVDNVCFIYELLDECLDLGVVQSTDYNILKEYIKILPNTPVSWKHDYKEKYLTDSDSDLDNDSDGIKKVKQKRKDNQKKAKHTIDNTKSTHNQSVKEDVVTEEANYVNSSILRSANLSISWRPKGIFYAKNEIFIDIIENCDFHYDLQEQVILKNEILGHCLVKSYLSGMPQCNLGFNETNMSAIKADDEVFTTENGREDNQLRESSLGIETFEDEDDEEKEKEKEKGKEEHVQGQDDQNQEKQIRHINRNRRRVPFRNIQFHQCVELDVIYRQGIMKFIPPDDKFVLMTYQVEQQRQAQKLPLIMIKPSYKIMKNPDRLQILCVLTTNFKKRLHAKDLSIRFPINPHLFTIEYNLVDSLKYKSELGDVNFKVDTSELVWFINDVEGKRPSVKMMAEIYLNNSVSTITRDRIQATLQNNLKFPKNDNTTHDEINEAKQELDSYYGARRGLSSLVTEIQSNLSKIHSFNHIRVGFEISMLSYSGLKLNYLKVEENALNYNCFPWIRYATTSDNADNSSLQDHIRHGNHTNNRLNCWYMFKLGIDSFVL